MVMFSALPKTHRSHSGHRCNEVGAQHTQQLESRAVWGTRADGMLPRRRTRRQGAFLHSLLRRRRRISQCAGRRVTRAFHFQPNWQTQSNRLLVQCTGRSVCGLGSERKRCSLHTIIARSLSLFSCSCARLSSLPLSSTPTLALAAVGQSCVLKCHQGRGIGRGIVLCPSPSINFRCVRPQAARVCLKTP